jgi:hypothetical protein
VEQSWWTRVLNLFFSSELASFMSIRAILFTSRKLGETLLKDIEPLNFWSCWLAITVAWGGLADKADEKVNTAAACGLSEDDFLLWSQSQDRACRRLVLLLTGGHGLRTLETATVSVSGPRVGADS